MDDLEMWWTGSGVMRNRRLGCLKLRRWTLCALMVMKREAGNVEAIDESQAMMYLWNKVE